MNKTCEQCGTAFKASNKRQRLCSKACANEVHKMPIADRLAMKSKQGPDECITWTGALAGGHDNNRYGLILYNGRLRYAHAVAYELAHGPIPTGKAPDGSRYEVNHTCQNRQCINSDHLELLSQKQHGAFHSKERKKDKVVKDFPLFGFAMNDEMLEWAIYNNQW